MVKPERALKMETGETGGINRQLQGESSRER